MNASLWDEYKPNTKPCEMCGNEFEFKLARAKYCPACAKRRLYQAQARYCKTQKGKNRRAEQIKSRLMDANYAQRLREKQVRYRKTKSSERKQYAHEYNRRPEVRKRKLETSTRYLERKKGPLYQKLVSLQGGEVCAICRREPPVIVRKKRGVCKKLYVDHCHASGVIRGLLCHNCNFGLGYFKDDPERLFSAIEYLRRFSESVCITPFEAIA